MGKAKRRELVVVLAGVEYESNLGMSVRAMKNFGVGQLRIVEPACASGNDAIMYSKRKEVWLVAGGGGRLRRCCGL
jgi:tRNA C32,U32 (ribose-2'-O)-methylase TrmJ